MSKFGFIFFITIYVNSLAQINTFVIQPDSTDGFDAWIWSFEPAREINFGSWNGINYNLHNVIRAEVWKWSGKETPDTIRGLLKFDLSDIPRSASIFEAKLSLYFFANEGFTPQLGNNEISIQRLVEGWSEDSVTWNNQPETSDRNKIVLEKSTSMDQDYLEIDIRNLVQEMVYFPEKNFGVMIKLLNEIEYSGVTFASSNHKDKAKHPKLLVKFIVQ